MMQPITSAAMNGLGIAPLGPLPGTWCVGFFRDGSSGQDPIVMGTLGGIPEQAADKTKGFFDPRNDPKLVETLETAPRKIQMRVYHRDGTGVDRTQELKAQPYPREIHPLDSTIGEPDTNRLARHQNIPDTIIGLRGSTLDGPVGVSDGAPWTEPPSSYNTVYPYNHVEESESGHLVEWDDTPGAERTHYWDRSGNFEENQADGTQIQKVTGDHYEIVMKKDFVHVMNDANHTFDKDMNLLVTGDWNIEVDGNINLVVKGSANIQVTGSVNQTVGGSVVQSVGGNVDETIGGKWQVKAGTIAFDASRIDFNSGVANPGSPAVPEVE
jgi:hypothetical protein